MSRATFSLLVAVLAGALAVAAATLPGRAAAAAVPAATYYVSPTGSDSNSGRSQTAAWRSVRKVNATQFAPGSTVLFRGGSSFTDTTLMPSSSGAAGKPVAFGVYGIGKPRLSGIWFNGRNHLTFRDFAISGAGRQGLQGTGDGVVAERLQLTGLQIGIQAKGKSWTIRDNVLDQIGDSGMILWGSFHQVLTNKITNTGRDSSISWGKHGIYSKVNGARYIGNTIVNSAQSGISVRYRDTTIESNTIQNAEIGLSWFQYDPIAGHSFWRNNKITGTTLSGIYVSPKDAGGNTRESFTITGNVITPKSGNKMNLKPTTGTYTVDQAQYR